MSGTHDVRRRLLDAATELIAEGGIHAATPAAVAERAGAAKMSLYRHFEGKDDLLEAALRHSDEPIRRRVLGADWTAVPDPRQRLLGMFASAARRAERPGYTGCPYVICGLEADAAEHPLAQVGTEHKDAVIAQLTGATRELGARDPEALARALLMLFDGAVAHAVIRGNGDPLRDAAAAAAALLDAA